MSVKELLKRCAHMNVHVYDQSMQFLPVLPLLNYFIQLCVLVPFLSIDNYISINYRCYDFWLAMKRLLVDDETTVFIGDELVVAMK